MVRVRLGRIIRRPIPEVHRGSLIDRGEPESPSALSPAVNHFLWSDVPVREPAPVPADKKVRGVREIRARKLEFAGLAVNQKWSSLKPAAWLPR